MGHAIPEYRDYTTLAWRFAYSLTSMGPNSQDFTVSGLLDGLPERGGEGAMGKAFPNPRLLVWSLALSAVGRSIGRF